MGINISKINLLILFLVILSFSVNIFLFLKMSDIQQNQNYVSGGSFHFVKPIERVPIDSNIQDSNIILHYNSLRNTIEQEIEKSNSTGKIGIFLQDINTGTWLGISEKEGFLPY